MRDNWIEVKLGKFAFHTKGKKPKRQEPAKNNTFKYVYVDIEAFEKGIIKSYTDGFKCNFCSESDFLMVWDGSRSGLVGKGISGALGSTLVSINFPKIENDFAFYFLQSKFQQINTRAKGTGTPHVDPNLLWNYDFPIAPLPEQRAIVAKIEQLFSDLDNGIANLKSAKDKLSIYRQSVLKKAFEGELTKEWRSLQTDLPTADQLLKQIKEERQHHYDQQLKEWQQAVKELENNGKEGKKPGKPKKIKDSKLMVNSEQHLLPQIPKEWIWCNLGNVCYRIQIGPFGSQLHKYDYVEQGIPIINPKHIRNHKILPKIFITKEKANSLPQYILNENDILLGRRGEMGRTANISEVSSGWFCGTGSLFIRLGTLFNGKLYSWIISERRVVNYLEDKGSGTTMTNLNSTILNDLPIQVIPLKEQNQIVQEIESRLSVCDKLEESIDTSLTQAEALRQSILKRAFEGKLLTDAELTACRKEPDWEPAEKLLERTKMEKQYPNRSKRR